jgi:hypothetical protein
MPRFNQTLSIILVVSICCAQNIFPLSMLAPAGLNETGYDGLSVALDPGAY